MNAKPYTSMNDGRENRFGAKGSACPLASRESAVVVGWARRTFLLTLLSLLPVPLISADESKEYPQPQGEPAYQRQAEGWLFGCWTYENSRVVHGRLRGKDGEVFGKRIGETIETDLGTLVWRGHYSSDKVPEKSTGWLFIESFSGPPYIGDEYDPKTDTLK